MGVAGVQDMHVIPGQLQSHFNGAGILFGTAGAL